MSRYSTSAKKISATILTSENEFDDDTENLETSPSPTGENVNAIITSTDPPQSPSQPVSPNISYFPQTNFARQSFFSLFKKKEIVSSGRPMSAPPQQLVAPISVPKHSNKDTLEELSTKNDTTDNNVSRSVIGSVSEPNLAAPNTDVSLEAEYDVLMKQQKVNGSVNDRSDGFDDGIADEKPSNNQPKKYAKRKGVLISIEKTDDKGFKNTMKNTMRKTSTFFKKFGNKPNVDNQLQQSVRSPLPDFQDVSGLQSQSSEILQDSFLTDTAEFSTPDTNDDTALSDNDCDEQEILQRTLEDYASVYANLQADRENRRRSGSYRMSLLSTNKSVPDNIGRISEWNGQTSNNENELTNEDSEPDKSNGDNTVIKNEKKNVESKQVVKAGLEQVRNEGSDGVSTRVSQQMSKSSEDIASARSPISPSALSTDRLITSKVSLQNPSSQLISAVSKSSFREEVDKRSLKINADQRGLLMKSKRSGSASGTDSGLSPSTIPKRPDKKLPDIPKLSEPDITHTHSPHMQQASSNGSSYYETASGSTSTLHTAPPSPIIDAYIGTSYIADGTCKIQLDGFVLTESPLNRNDEGEYFSQGVPEKDEEETLRAEAKNVAKKCFDEDETFIKKEEITEYLGGHKSINSRALKYYMDYYDFSNLRLDVAFRRLCGKLYIKGETQQVDRILEAFSIRYWNCNPKTIYGSADIVHAITYSILLLNTDLHVAQLANKMSRSQFVRNTMAAVHFTQANMAAKNNNGSYEDDQSTSISPIETSTTGTSRPRRSGSVKSWRSNPNSGTTNLSFMSSRHWDSEVESLLKEMYSAIKTNQILQPVSSSSSDNATVESSNTGSNTGLNTGLYRSMSQSYPNSRINALKKGLSAGNVKSRKNNNGRISPSPSSVSGGSDSSGTGLDSLNRSGSSQTLPTTLSSFSLRHASSSSEIGFNSTIPEHGPDDDRASIADSVSTNESLELYLSGAPYAKEGLLVRKQYWESTSKRAKDKGWKECFVIIEKGDIKMYKFETNSSHSSMGIGAVGGGNWMENATLMGEVNLRHTITNALPPPGYNRSRPHVFALSMSNGGLYFFQAGTAELVNEWVATCNYWAARMSKEPLTGGVGSMEYGWGRCLDGGEDWEDCRSVTSDGRSVTSGSSSHASDRIVVSEWKAPLPPTVSSTFDEETQLAALKRYIVDLENELEQHKNFWEPMSKLFHPRSSNYTRAFSNWEKKSKWLLYEIVKYKTYIECINNSINLHAERRKEKDNSKNNELNQNNDTDTNEETRREKRRAELRERARQSIKLVHRATWTPGEFSLNLPKDLFEGTLSNLEEDEDDDDNISSPKSFTYSHLNNNKVVIEEERRIGDFNSNVDYEVGQKWVDRFA